ncbi:MAG TPA: nitrate reductase cytochrome c-type subunit; periplasmic nitrate reductase electron transfer subunit [Gammaproteobacteria bacterium]|nr:nitrate reductase cytochrome c-type subunit; periplasmic nitrate reductase electron transfer subunit [Gammaproteobacteria bacterium]
MRTATMAILLAGVCLVLAGSAAAVDLRSLRGDRPLDARSSRPARAKVILPEKGEFPKSYKTHPPMIPHRVDKTRISLKKNQCLKCHGELEHKEIDAPMVSKTHFVDRQGRRLGHVSTRYYFCTQCHAPQVDKTPIVQNLFDAQGGAR